VDEVNKDVQLLKSMECILQERMQSFNSFVNTVSKARPSFEAFQFADGSLRQGLDSLFVYMEQELQQGRLQSSLTDVRKAISELARDAARKLGDYQKEAVNAEKEIVTAERKLMKSKDALEKCQENRLRVGEQSGDRLREVNESIYRAEKDIRDDVAALLRVLRNKDQIMSASRRAHQKLDKECKKTLSFALKRMLARERESCEARIETLRKFETAVDDVNVDHDINDFIDKYVSSESCLVLQSQALSILGDLMVSDSDFPSTPGQGNRSNAASPGLSLPHASSTPTSTASTPRNSFTSASSPRNTSASPPVDMKESRSRNVSVDNNSSAAAALLVSKLTNPLPSSPLLDDRDNLNGANNEASISSKRQSMNADHLLQHRPSGTQEQANSTLTADVTKHITRLFYASEDEWVDRPDSVNMPSGLSVLQLAKDRTDPALLDENSAKQLITASVSWLGEAVKTQFGRDAFVTVLNQFRSRKASFLNGIIILLVSPWIHRWTSAPVSPLWALSCGRR
jgi:hypothetical protein